LRDCALWWDRKKGISWDAGGSRGVNHRQVTGGVLKNEGGGLKETGKSAEAGGLQITGVPRD